MDQSYTSALAALAGTVAGCATSLFTSWFTVRSQSRLQRTERERNSRRELYDRFIDEASKIYIHALENSSTEVSMLVGVYATLNEIRMISSPTLTAAAEKAVQNIVLTYTRENKSFTELVRLLEEGFPDPLKEFSETCRQELQTI